MKTLPELKAPPTPLALHEQKTRDGRLRFNRANFHLKLTKKNRPQIDGFLLSK